MPSCGREHTCPYWRPALSGPRFLFWFLSFIVENGGGGALGREIEVSHGHMEREEKGGEVREQELERDETREILVP